MTFSEEQILSIAPDDSSRKSGKELANDSKWIKRETSERAIWGDCQGSGKFPYQTQVDLVNIAFKCSCPSRKFPCKHGLALLLLFARDKKSFKSAPEPASLTEWLDKRNERGEKKSDKKEKSKSIDPAAQAKRQENRLKRVEDGTAELRLWIKDIIRNGLLNVPDKDPSYFENMARRMIDAQAPGLSNMIRSLRDTNFYQEGWQTPFMDQVIRIYLVLEGFSQMETLDPALQDELKSLVGFSQNQDELKNENGFRDQWFVLAKRTDKEDNLTTERNWLYGLSSKKYALVLQFYVRGQVPQVSLIPGSCIDAELVYFKGAETFRALVKDQSGMTSPGDIRGYKNWDDVMTAASSVHASNPWHSYLPFIIENVSPLKGTNEWFLKDQNGKGVKISHRFTQTWRLLSISGGKPIRLFAVGREHYFEPMAAWADNEFILLT